MAFGPIATLPSLLPALFQLTGQAVPKGYNEAMQPTLDILELLAASNCLEIPTVANQLVSVPGVVRPPELVVPQTEAWLVRGASCFASTLGTEGLRMALVQGRATATGQIVARRWPLSTASASDGTSVASVLSAMDQDPILLFANDFIGCNVERIATVGTIQIGFSAQIFRFSV